MNSTRLRVLSYLGLFCMFLVCVELRSLPAYADGGAPQLSYVTGTLQGISVIDIAQRRVIRTLAVTGDPHAILLSLDGSALYVTQPASGQLTIISTQTDKTICTATLPGQPSLLALSIDATTLYVAGQGDTQVRAINPTNCAIERTFETHQPVYGLAITASTSPDATPLTPNQLWIAGGNGLTVFEVNGHLLGTVPIAGGARFISIPGGFTAYVTTQQGTIVAVDLNARKIFKTLLNGGQFGPMDYDANTGEVYVPDRLHNQLDVLAPVAANASVMPHEPARVIPLASAPQSVAITSDGQLGFVALASGQVLMLDIPGRSTITTISVGGMPHFIITGLYPPTANPTTSASHPTNPPPSSGLPYLPLLIGAVVVVVLGVTGGSILFRRKRAV